MHDKPDDRVPESDLVPEDDAVIGRALRWSMVGLFGLIGVVGLLYLATRISDQEQPSLSKELGDVADRNSASAALPEVRFTDITREAGIDFVHVNGATGEKLLPETMGGGAAFLDADGDGDQDLLLVSGEPWPHDSAGVSGQALTLFLNDGRGRFTDGSQAAGLDFSAYGFGVAVGDHDNDGDPDLFLATLGGNRLLENVDGRFADVTTKAGVAGMPDSWSTSAGFYDYDNDGDLDLFVCNYVQWSREIDEELDFTLNGHDRAYGPPTSYAGTFPYLYRNEGDGRFTDVSAFSGIQVRNPATGMPMGKGLAVSFTDFDRDGHIDIAVANDTVQNFLFHNQGNGEFREIGLVSGFGFDSAGNATGAMGLDIAHYRNDDQLAIAIGNFANEMTSFYVAEDREMQFSDDSIAEGVGAPSRGALSFGLYFFDHDLDGRLDILQANGHLDEQINQVQASQHYRQPAQLFWNAGSQARSTFTEVPRDRVGDLSRPIVGRGATYADIDGDGDLDVLLTSPGDQAVLLRNDQVLGHNWLRLKLRGTRSNRDAIGAWVIAEVDGEVRRRQVMPTRSYLSQVELPVTIGLGKAERVDRLMVRWPDGSEQPVTVEAINTTIEVIER